MKASLTKSYGYGGYYFFPCGRHLHSNSDNRIRSITDGNLTTEADSKRPIVPLTIPGLLSLGVARPASSSFF